jgi:hypothetical protein
MRAFADEKRFALKSESIKGDNQEEEYNNPAE